MSELYQNELKRFGMRLAEIRKQKGWTQERLALESELGRSYLGGVERGLRNISLINIVRLAKSLDIPVSQLFIDDNETLSALLDRHFATIK